MEVPRSKIRCAFPDLIFMLSFLSMYESTYHISPSLKMLLCGCSISFWKSSNVQKQLTYMPQNLSKQSSERALYSYCRVVYSVWPMYIILYQAPTLEATVFSVLSNRPGDQWAAPKYCKTDCSDTSGYSKWTCIGSSFKAPFVESASWKLNQYWSANRSGLICEIARQIFSLFLIKDKVSTVNQMYQGSIQILIQKYDVL